MRIKAVALLAVVFATAGVVAGGDAKAEQKKFAGTWSIASAQKGGKDAPDKEVKDVRLVFAGGKVTFKHGEKSLEGSFKIDPAKKPSQIDLTVMDMPLEGIYRFNKGGTLELCLGEPGAARPTEFKSAEGSQTMRIVLKREKE